MEAAIAQMMRDLGSARKDVSSMPPPKASEVEFIRHEEDLIRRQSEKRRNDILAVDEDSGEDKIKKAWNTHTNFSSDPLMDGLQNTTDGQAHRPKLNPGAFKRDYNDQLEDDEAPATAERREWDKERANRNYSASHPLPMDRRPGRDATPRNGLFASGEWGRLQENVRPRQASNRNRAPSPRQQGVTRFNKDGSRVVVAGPAKGKTNATPQKRAQAKTTGANAIPLNQPRTIPPIRATAPTPTAALSLFNKTKATPAARTQPRTLPAVKQFSLSQTVAQNVAQNNAPSVKQLQMKAEIHAAGLGVECAEWINEDPATRERMVDRARVNLIGHAITLAKDPGGEDHKRYIKINPKRTWLVDAAIKARSLIESGSVAEMESYYDAVPEHLDIFEEAKLHFKKKPKAEGDLIDVSVSTDTAPKAINGVKNTDMMATEVDAVTATTTTTINDHQTAPSATTMPGTAEEAVDEDSSSTHSTVIANGYADHHEDDGTYDEEINDTTHDEQPIVDEQVEEEAVEEEAINDSATATPEDLTDESQRNVDISTIMQQVRTLLSSAWTIATSSKSDIQMEDLLSQLENVTNDYRRLSYHSHKQFKATMEQKMEGMRLSHDGLWDEVLE